MAEVLIIDDDRLVCNSIANVVKKLGHSAPDWIFYLI